MPATANSLTLRLEGLLRMQDSLRAGLLTITEAGQADESNQTRDRLW